MVVGTMLGSGALAWLVATLIGGVRHGMFWRAHPEWTFLATYAGVLLAGLLLLGSIGRSVTMRQLRSAFWLLFLGLGAVIGLYAPGGIVFFIFPPLLALAGIVGCELGFPTERVGSVLALILLYFTWGAMLGLLQELLNGGPTWLFAPLSSLLLIPALIEAKPLIDKLRLRESSILAAILLLGCWGAAAAAPAYSADRQQRFVIQHVAAPAQSWWSIVNDAAPLPASFGSGWRRGKLPLGDTIRWIKPAPPDPSSNPPSVKLVSELRSGNERTLTLRLAANGNDEIELVAPEDARIRSAGVAGFVRPIDQSAEGKYYLGCSGRSCDGAILQLTTDQPKPIRFLVIGWREGLPASAAPLLRAKPRFARPQYSPSATIVFTRLNL